MPTAGGKEEMPGFDLSSEDAFGSVETDKEVPQGQKRGRRRFSRRRRRHRQRLSQILADDLSDDANGTFVGSVAVGDSGRIMPTVAQRTFASVPIVLDICDDASCGLLQTKVISISLYGGLPRYTAGAVRNAELARTAFPDWQLWVYIPDAPTGTPERVPDDIIAALSQVGAHLLFVDAATVASVGFGMNQRFLPAGEPNVHRFVARDGDSRLLLRERIALDAWEASGAAFHAVRDHPSHSNFHLSGGLWGAVRGTLDIRNLLSAQTGGKAGYLDDMWFLNGAVWPIMTGKAPLPPEYVPLTPGAPLLLQHDAFTCAGGGGDGGHGRSAPWPAARAGGEHVGGVYDEADVIRRGDVDLLPSEDAPACASPPAPVDGRALLTPAELVACTAPERGEAGFSSPPLKAGEPASPALQPPTCAGPPGDTHAGGAGLFGGPYAGLGNAGRVGSVGGAVASSLLTWRAAFVDHAYEDSPSGCADGFDVDGTEGSRAIVPPTIFDYKRVLAWESYPARCQPQPPARPSYANTPQYDARIARPHTHYTALGPGGLRHVHNLLVVQASWSSDPHFVLAHALPWLWWWRRSGPARGARMLLPAPAATGAGAAVDEALTPFTAALAELQNANSVGDAARREAAGLPLLHESATSTGSPWHHQVDWVALQGGPPSLTYAHRVVIAALGEGAPPPQEPRCSSLTALERGRAVGAAASAAEATAAAAHAALLHAEPGWAPRDRLAAAAGGACSAVILRAVPVGARAGAQQPGFSVESAAVALFASRGYGGASVLDPCAAPFAEQLASVAGAHVLLLPPATLSPYLAHARAGARVLIAADAGGELAVMDYAAAAAVDAALAGLCATAGLTCEWGTSSESLIATLPACTKDR